MKKYEGNITPLIYGGAHQEYGLRGGTQNVPGIVGFGKACELINIDRTKSITRNLKKEFLTNLEFDYTVNMPEFDTKILSLTIDGVDAETLAIVLSSRGVCISAGSACKSQEQKPSEVLLAAGFSESQARNTVRISFSDMNTLEEVREAAKIMNECVRVLQ